MNIAADHSDVNLFGLSTIFASDLVHLERVAQIMLQLDDVCKAAARLRAGIQREMLSASDREKLAGDDPAVTTARKAARRPNRP